MQFTASFFMSFGTGRKAVDDAEVLRIMWLTGLPSHPDHEIAKAQMDGFGGVISFEVLQRTAATMTAVHHATKALHAACCLPCWNSVGALLQACLAALQVDGDMWRTAKLVDSVELPYIAPSLGGCESLIEQPTIVSYWDQARGRLATGTHGLILTQTSTSACSQLLCGAPRLHVTWLRHSPLL
jgi:cystathionine beta-lyase/cystathionine gamma-synthase